VSRPSTRSHFSHTLMHLAAEEAQKSVKGLEETTIHAKYIELVKRFPSAPSISSKN
jgi:hypothetical protein